MVRYVIHSGGGELYGPYISAEEAEDDAEEEREMLGDYDIQPLYDLKELNE